MGFRVGKTVTYIEDQGRLAVVWANADKKASQVIVVDLRADGSRSKADMVDKDKLKGIPPKKVIDLLALHMEFLQKSIPSSESLYKMPANQQSILDLIH